MTSSERVSPLHFLCFVWKGKSHGGSNSHLYWILTSCMVWLMCIRERSQPATKEKCVAFENLKCNFPCPILKGIEIGQAKYQYLLERKKLDGSGEFEVFFFFSIFYVHILFSKAIKIYSFSLVTQNMTKIDQIISLPNIYNLKSLDL